jgi:hypothetical protein
MSCGCKYICGMLGCKTVEEMRGTVWVGTYLSEHVVMATSLSTGDAGLSNCHRHRPCLAERACV